MFSRGYLSQKNLYKCWEEEKNTNMWNKSMSSQKRAFLNISVCMSVFIGLYKAALFLCSLPFKG